MKIDHIETINLLFNYEQGFTYAGGTCTGALFQTPEPGIQILEQICLPALQAPVFVIQALVAIWQLELVNYVEHYGLTRQRLPCGKFEPVRPRMSTIPLVMYSQP